MKLGKTVKELFADLGGIYEYELWKHYYNECPFGDYRNDLREALNCAILLAPHSKSDLTIKDFLLIKDVEEKKEDLPSAQELVNKTKAMIRGMRPPNGRK